VVIERLPNGQFHLLSTAPPWLDRAFAAAPAGERQSLGGAFPFLEDVVHQAVGAWQAGSHASMVFGPFAAVVDGDELLMRATALTVEHHTLLVIDRLVGAADARPMLQKARERLLEGEQLTHRAEAVHVPAEGVAKAVAALVSGPWPPDHSLLDALYAADARLQRVVAELPLPPAKKR
jgi:hypothetical protein